MPVVCAELTSPHCRDAAWRVLTRPDRNDWQIRRPGLYQAAPPDRRFSDWFTLCSLFLPSEVWTPARSDPVRGRVNMQTGCRTVKVLHVWREFLEKEKRTASGPS